jgi:tetratricopeptide (TPR) repeat protein
MMGESNLDDELFEPIGDEPGPALPLAAERAEAIARAAVRKARSAAAPRWSSPLALAAAAALALALAGSAAAAIAYLIETREVAAPAEPVHAAPRAPAPPAAPRSSVPPTEPSALAEPSQPRPEPSAAHELSSASPGELLERANRLRGAARYAEAERLYSRVARDGRDVDSAYVAMVAAAELRLEHARRPKDALALYERALRQRPEGVLAPSVRFGIARAHRSLGNRAAEARALAELIAEHPEHVLRARGEARLKELRTEP